MAVAEHPFYPGGTSVEDSEINFVALLWIFSISTLSRRYLGLQMTLAYSRWGLTILVNNLGSVVSSMQANVAQTSPSILDALFTASDTWAWNLKSLSIFNHWLFQVWCRSCNTPSLGLLYRGVVFCICPCQAFKSQMVGSDLYMHVENGFCNFCVFTKYNILMRAFVWKQFVWTPPIKALLCLKLLSNVIYFCEINEQSEQGTSL